MKENDLISRQAAIDALRTMQTYKFDPFDDKKIVLTDAEDAIEALPSAQQVTINESDAELKLLGSNDIISRQAAIDQLHQSYSLFDAEDRLKELPSAQPEQRWIPCNERLPEARRSVILSTKDWTGEGCYWETTEYHVIWKAYRWNVTYWDDEVVAWMPLPEPYKAERRAE